jgi:hypothetical protein
MEELLKEIERKSEQQTKQEKMEGLQRALGTSFDLLAEGRFVVRQTRVHLTRPKAVEGALVLLNDLVLLASVQKKSLQYIMSAAPASFRFAPCRPSPESFFLLHNDREYVVQFADRDDKRNWMIRFAELRNRAFDDFHPRGRFARWFELEVVDAVPALMNHDGCSNGREVLFFGGTNASLADVNLCLLYSHETELWQAGNCLVPPRSSHTVTECGGSAYVCFGRRKRETLSDIWRYDFGTREWLEMKSDASRKRWGHSCVAIGEELFIFGGRDDAGRYLDDLSVFDTRVGTIRSIKTASGPRARAFHSAVALACGRMLVIGGRTEEAIVGDAHVFDPAAGTWTDTGLALGRRMFHRSHAIGDLVLTVGGSTGSRPAELLVLDASDWFVFSCPEYGNVPFGLARFALARVSDRLLVAFGGTDGLTQTPYLSSYIIDLVGIFVAPLADSVESAARPRRPRHHHGRRKTTDHFGALPPQPESEDALDLNRAISVETFPIPRVHASGRLPTAVPESSTEAPEAPPPAAVEQEPRSPDLRKRPKAIDEGRLIVKQGEQPSYAVQELLTDLGIDVSLLSPFETAATMIKARRLNQMRDQNHRLLAQVSRLEQVRAGVGGLPPNTPVLMKLCDEDARQTRILRVNSDNTADEIREMVTEVVGRSVVLSVRVSPARRDAFTQESLREAYGSICKQELTALMVIAM